MKKILSVLAMLSLVGTLAFAQEAEVAEEAAAAEENGSSVFFKNTIRTPIIEVGNDGSVKFAGAYEEMEAGYNSEKLDIYAKARGKIMTSDDGVPTGIGYDASETYFGINYKPGYGIGLGFGQAFYIPGSYMAVEDDYVALGNIASPGFTFSYSGVEGLMVAATFDFISGVYDNNFILADGSYNFNTGIGAYYAYKDLFTVGAKFLFAAANTYRFGVYGSVNPCEGLSFYAGYTYNAPDDDLYISGQAVNFSFIYEIADFYVMADYDTSFADNFYTGVLLGYNVTDAVAIEVYATAETTYSAFADGSFCAAPSVTYVTEKCGKFVAEVDVNFEAGGFDSVTFPVKWVYSF